MRIGLLSDTHGFLDDAVFRHFADCDEIWHARDFGTVEVLDQLSAFKPVRAVYGNVDGAELRADLPEDLVWDCQGIAVYMTHIGGYPGNYDRRAGKEVQRLRPGLFICGHSHIPESHARPGARPRSHEPRRVRPQRMPLRPHSAAIYRGSRED